MCSGPSCTASRPPLHTPGLSASPSPSQALLTERPLSVARRRENLGTSKRMLLVLPSWNLGSQEKQKVTSSNPLSVSSQLVPIQTCKISVLCFLYKNIIILSILTKIVYAPSPVYQVRLESKGLWSQA